MSFFYVKMVAFSLIAIISTQYEDKKIEKNQKLQYAISTVLIMVSILSIFQNIKVIRDKLPIESIEQQIKECEKIAKQEIWYSKVELYDILTQCAIRQIEQGQKDKAEETLQKAYEILKQRENLYPIRIENYVEEYQTIVSNIFEVRQYSQIDSQEYIKESKNQIEKIIAEAKENITDYTVTRMSESYYKEKMQKLEKME